ncbi:arsenite methyltransferase [Salinirubrum litoreum]|uniref:Arsenite methyltransferase n=1 Tax=Salinirubrum litoreum TaxID=1126234 RepID=A0ABD5RFV7_9EURY|nr:arsenite methyltransferase [Salinirubrum litoreum]
MTDTTPENDGDKSSRSSDGSGPEAQRQRRAVRERYAAIAGGRDDGTDGDRSDTVETDDAGCCSTGPTCCGDATDATTDDTDAECAPGSPSGVDETAARLGYSADEIDSVGDGANLGLGCGNPQAIAALQPGETVLDLGSGAGFDCFLAADAVGPAGRVIGVDMTPEMVERARKNARQQAGDVVEFRLGEIEHLPVADDSVDAVISNCVVNLSPDKAQVFRDAFRVLRSGGRLAISDVVRTAPVPEDRRADPDSVAGCTAGAASISELETMLTDAGFEAVGVDPVAGSDQFIREWDPERDPSEYLTSARITGQKPPTA